MPDGRAILDPLCVADPFLLTRTGALYLVRPTVSDVDKTRFARAEGGAGAAGRAVST
ncbi:hypothetical protein [Amycolatopsis rubida]|uniref:hypothetical protein n=1 Tax=Amycolatopsis rubida TaxID=112413 RepID=UPI001AD82093|nr:hypothetical protein [Amycolatopsis rubida]